ncbi:phosphomannomutase [Vibrio sinensis]|uniref:Phosphomannomutase n=1 Tax=Vibrio sinensis TaxID=2302434 RepID=A0A3A6QIC5_9VIBR|nr:phosphomannomutase [Vibrio sinensis]RJX72373.1 phosphomannomutase [Vibrio sinensis]
MLISSRVIKNSGVTFGTSGARGLVEQFSPEVCVAFTYAFIKSIKERFVFNTVAIAIDNRPSSPVMAQACMKALEQLGLNVNYYGVVPTPALAYVAMQDNIPCIMVTGSHIPFDRNGLKFYRPNGEISKDDEQAILNANVKFDILGALPELLVNPRAAQVYVERYISLFNASTPLNGKRIGIYEHSSAGRDLYSELFTRLGAEVISLGRSDKFVPIDTEAVSERDRRKAQRWSKQYDLDAIFSTDGDGDRPLVADENGDWLRGDILGVLCSKALNIEAIAVPVSCNTLIENCDWFNHVKRTRIGSPYVIAEFDNLNYKYKTVAGFEANGGYLLGSDVWVNHCYLQALPTRDAVLPALMLLATSGSLGIANLVNELPKRVTYSDRIQNFSIERSDIILKHGIANTVDFLDQLGFSDIEIRDVNTLDGLRIILSNNAIIHLRPSGNAPELRCYAEADDLKSAQLYVGKCLEKIKYIQI